MVPDLSVGLRREMYGCSDLDACLRRSHLLSWLR